MTNCVRLNEQDNVVTTIARVEKGGSLVIEGAATLRVEAKEAIPIYHKASIADIRKGSRIYKYGQPIGLASADIAAGRHVHTHNLVSESDYRAEAK